MPPTPSEKFLAIDRDTLRDQGWFSWTLATRGAATFRGQLMTLAEQLGCPVPTRLGGEICETLRPTDASCAAPHSLSKIYSQGEFPLHIDTAHWLKPCRFILLACLVPGAGNRQTVLLDTRRLPLNREESSVLRSTPLRVANGRNSFFSTVVANHRPFIRYDPGCMMPVTPEGRHALEILSSYRWVEHLHAIHWHKGKVVVIDNWRLLHGRGNTDSRDSERTLLRISIL